MASAVFSEKGMMRARYSSVGYDTAMQVKLRVKREMWRALHNARAPLRDAILLL